MAGTVPALYRQALDRRIVERQGKAVAYLLAVLELYRYYGRAGLVRKDRYNQANIILLEHDTIEALSFWSQNYVYHNKIYVLDFYHLLNILSNTFLFQK